MLKVESFCFQQTFLREWVGMNLLIPFSKIKGKLKEGIVEQTLYSSCPIFDVTGWLKELKEAKLSEEVKQELALEIPDLICEALERKHHPLHDYFQGYNLKETEISELFWEYPHLDEHEQTEVRKWLDTDCCLTVKELKEEHPNQEVEKNIIELEVAPCRMYLDLEETVF